MLWIINQLSWQVSNNDTHHTAYTDSPFILAYKTEKEDGQNLRAYPGSPQL